MFRRCRSAISGSPKDPDEILRMLRHNSKYVVYFENAFYWYFFHHNLKMHGPSCKIVLPQQANLINTCKNTRLKLLKTNAAIWFNKQHL
jgi:hypothetical protein